MATKGSAAIDKRLTDVDNAEFGSFMDECLLVWLGGTFHFRVGLLRESRNEAYVEVFQNLSLSLTPYSLLLFISTQFHDSLDVWAKCYAQVNRFPLSHIQSLRLLKHGYNLYLAEHIIRYDIQDRTGSISIKGILIE
jgi:hypothetical protein